MVPRFKPPLPSPPLKVVSGLNGATPTVWDPGWQLFTDLTTDQIAAYVAMPQWQTFVVAFNTWQQNPSGNAPTLTGLTVAL